MKLARLGSQRVELLVDLVGSPAAPHLDGGELMIGQTKDASLFVAACVASDLPPLVQHAQQRVAGAERYWFAYKLGRHGVSVAVVAHA